MNKLYNILNIMNKIIHKTLNFQIFEPINSPYNYQHAYNSLPVIRIYPF